VAVVNVLVGVLMVVVVVLLVLLGVGLWGLTHQPDHRLGADDIERLTSVTGAYRCEETKPDPNGDRWFDCEDKDGGGGYVIVLLHPDGTWEEPEGGNVGGG
jgi:hypothetical protein